MALIVICSRRPLRIGTLVSLLCWRMFETASDILQHNKKVSNTRMTCDRAGKGCSVSRSTNKQLRKNGS